jgi:hypothetical protein
VPQAIGIENGCCGGVSPDSNYLAAFSLVKDILEMLPGRGIAVIVNWRHVALRGGGDLS